MQRSAFILSLLLLAGCAQKNSDQSVTSPADFVAVTLGQAAENAHSELAMLAKLRGQGLQPLRSISRYPLHGLALPRERSKRCASAWVTAIKNSAALHRKRSWWWFAD